jgi:hypothetical protein
MANARSLINIVKRRYHRGWSDPRVARDIRRALILNRYECEHCSKLLAAGVIEHGCFNAARMAYEEDEYGAWWDVNAHA